MFPSTVNLTQAPAVPGDFASENPRHSLLSASTGGWQAGAAGVYVGGFVWADATNTVLNSTATGSATPGPSGFVARQMNALITTYLSGSSMLIPAGFGVGEAFRAGDFWALNSGSSAVTVGMKAYASTANGSVIQFAATGQTITGYVETRFYAHTPGVAGDIIIISTTAIG